jgi:hypothetical protein
MTFFEEIKRPFNLVTLFLAITGILLSVFLYYKSEKVKGISYMVNEPPSLIFDSKNSSSAIKVVGHDNVSINGDVYLLTGSLWNSGDYPISKEDARLPLSISLNNNSQILDFKITKQKDSAIANFVLLKEKPNSLNIGWNYFDPGFGFKFQIMYIGSNISEFKINGKILDVKEFTKVDIFESKNNLLVTASCCFVLLCIATTYYFFSSKEDLKKDNMLFWVLMIVNLVCLLSYLLWVPFISLTTDPI